MNQLTQSDIDAMRIAKAIVRGKPNHAELLFQKISANLMRWESSVLRIKVRESLEALHES